MIGKRNPVRRRAAFQSALALFVVLVTGAVAAAAELNFDIHVEGGRIPDNMRLIRAKKGDVVHLRWTTDRPVVVHLHGYDIEHRLAAGASTDLNFTAIATGRFPIHLHAQAHGPAGQVHDESPIAIVEVYPR